MKVNQLICVFLFLLLFMAAADANLPVVSVKNPDGSVIKASANAEIMAQLASEEYIAVTNAAAAAITNKFSLETKAQAEKGDAIAQVILGFRYFRGMGVAKDFTEAVKWFQKAADQGNIDAENNLGACYANGFGLAQDKTEADKWYHKAAEQEFNETKFLAGQGDAKAQFNVGLAYNIGDVVEKNWDEAIVWYLKAAKQGYVYAQNNLAVCYARGSEKVQDKVQAAKWYYRAAKQGLAASQNALGSCYANGEGLPKDYVEAYKWVNLAAAQANEDARGNLSIIEQWMTPEQIAQAQELAREFKPRKESGFENSTSPKNPTASGSGFFITDDGYLISNYHVVKAATKVRLVMSSGTVDAKVVQVDAANDLALLKANGKFSPLPIAASRSAHLGGTVATIGFPDPSLQGFSPKLAKGEIASLSGAGDDPRYFQISVPVQHGNSGGALVDDHGNVVGVVSARLGVAIGKATTSDELPENVNYAVKSSLLLSFLESVPEVSAKLKEPLTAERKFEDVVKSAQDAAVLVLVY